MTCIAGRGRSSPDVLHVFVVEVVEGGEYRVGRSLPQSAEGGVLYHLPQGGEGLQVFLAATSFGYLVQYFQQALVADAARGAFSARLLYREVQIEAGYGHHAVVLIHYNHAAGTHHGTFSKQVVEVYRGIQMLLRQAAARRTSGLHSLELLAAFDAAAYFVDYFAEGGSHRNLYQSYVIYFSCKGKNFCPLGEFSSDS